MNLPKKVILYKLGRLQADFEFIFPNVKVVKYITDNKERIYNGKECLNINLLTKKQRHLIIICDRKNDEAKKRFDILNFTEYKDFVFLEDIAENLNESYTKQELKELDEYNRVFNSGCHKEETSNSEMFIKMIYTDVKYDVACGTPFIYAQIQCDGSMYTCCGSDWVTENIGNVYYSTPNKIWNSTKARLFRLSIINKTYAFCNLNICPLEINEINEDFPRDINIKELEYPEKVCLAFDQTCNLKCKSCRCHAINENNNEEKQQMYNKLIDKIFSDKWNIKPRELIIASQGEVFFSNAYKKILFSDKTTKRESISIHTNGILLNKENVDKLCNLYKEISFYISVDSITDEIYDKIRFGGKFSILKKNLEYLSQIKAEGKIHSITLLCVLQKDNYKELPNIIKFAIDLGFDRVDISKICNWGTYTDEEFKKISMYDEKGNPKPELVKILKNPIFKTNQVELLGSVMTDINKN